MRGFLMIGALLAAGGPLQSQGRVTGTQIKQICIVDYDKTPKAKIACEALVIGVVEGISRGAFMSIKNANPELSNTSIAKDLPDRLGFCIPTALTRGQVAGSFRTYLTKYPTEEDLKLPFDQLIYEYLVIQYPCR